MPSGQNVGDAFVSDATIKCPPIAYVLFYQDSTINIDHFFKNDILIQCVTDNLA